MSSGWGPRRWSPDALQRLYCTCAPVWDYTGQEVWPGWGFFGHGSDDRPILTDHHRGVWDPRAAFPCAGYLPPALESTA
ncbi:MAG: hypothetical protein R2712_01720 [Vicinamibacterales bacterium]